MSNDRYERIRTALTNGPTPGPRRVIDGDSYPYVTVALPENEGRRWDDPVVCALYEDATPDDYIGFGKRLQTYPNARTNAAFIAACDPDTVRALLDERDALAAEVERLRTSAVSWSLEASKYAKKLDKAREREARQAERLRLPPSPPTASKEMSND